MGALEDVEIGDTLLQLADAGDMQDAIGLCRSLSRKPRKGEDREKLRAVSRKLIERFPDEPALQIAVATMLLRSGTLPEAHELLRQIKRNFPDEERVHELLGEVLLRMGDARGAVIALERALTLHQDVAIEEVQTEARVLTRLQDARGEEAVAGEARDILGDPSEPLAVRRRGLSNVKTPIVNDVRGMLERHGSSGPVRVGTPARSTSTRPRAGGSSYPSTGLRVSEKPPAYVGASAAPPPRAASSSSPVLRTSVPPPPPDMPVVHARDEQESVSRRTWILGAIAAVATIGAGGLLASRLSEGRRFDLATINLAIDAMLTARPSQLDRATAFTRRVLGQAPKSSEVAVRAVQAATLALLDGRESPGGLEAAIEEAKSRGANPPEVAAGEALSMLARGQVAEAKARLANVEPGGQEIDAVVLHVVRGVILERASDPGARAAYEAAVEADSKAVAALVRIARMFLAEGDGEAAATAIQRLEALGPEHLPIVTGLRTIARQAGVPLPGAGDDASAPKRLDEDVPRALRAAGLAIEAATVADPGQADAMMGAAVLAAETATDAALVGRIALRRGSIGAARLAIARAAELGPGDPRAAFLAAQLAFERGELGAVEEAQKKLPERAAAACTGLLAYERGDLAGLTAAAPRASSFLAPALKLATDRLQAARPLDPADLKRLASREGPFGELVAVDAWLDRGSDADLEAAAEIALRRWSPSERGPLRAARVARLLRLRGDHEAARAALGDAVQAGTPGAFVEALLLRTRADVGLTSRAEAVGKPAGPWIRALERATAKDQAGAKKLIKAEAVPGPDAGIVTRLAAAHALAAVDDARGKAITRELTAVFPELRDLAREKKAAAGGGRRAAPVDDQPYE